MHSEFMVLSIKRGRFRLQAEGSVKHRMRSIVLAMVFYGVSIHDFRTNESIPTVEILVACPLKRSNGLVLLDRSKAKLAHKERCGWQYV